jgi:hypothetical protein
MNKRFPIGLTFLKKHFPKAKEMTKYSILNIYTTKNEAGNVVKIEYLIEHDFLGIRITELVCDTSIARCLSNDQLKELK